MGRGRTTRAALLPGRGPLAGVPPLLAFLVVIGLFTAGVLVRGAVGAGLLLALAAGSGCCWRRPGGCSRRGSAPGGCSWWRWWSRSRCRCSEPRDHDRVASGQPR
ncbi:hypothetical protein ACFQV2_08890 [Actinokineospora soli]|uniref:Uncharacterized protein n=1 Tax=Actinokineospora soli TaxID=1048753 RepID=A0ABW2TLG5_9PSEU